MKERFEWIRSWCDETQNTDLPRVLLVGDSITLGYQEKVRQKLKGVCYVDFISCSYAIDTKIYNTLISGFAADSNYSLIHFNHGLHGQHMTKRTYFSKMKKLAEKLGANSRIVFATSTIVFSEGNVRLDRVWTKRLKERNDAVKELANLRGDNIDDLYAVSVNMPKEYRSMDGIHYTEDGYETFAVAVAECVQSNLKTAKP